LALEELLDIIVVMAVLAEILGLMAQHFLQVL
jgi:hypothetical protein